MKTKSFILFLLIAVITNSCSSSTQTQKGEYKVDDFSSISSSAGIDIYFTQGNKYSVEIVAENKDLKNISVTVRNGNLELRRINNNWFKTNSTVKAYVTAKEIKAIALSGGADFHAEEVKTKKTFSIATSGGSDTNITKLVANNCEIALSGGADCKISNLEVEELSIATSGGSDADINIKDANKVEAAASGGSDITLSGKTKKITVNVSGGADANISSLTYQKIQSNKSGGGSINE